MKRRSILKILLGIIALVIILKIFLTLLAEPWVRKKIIAELNKTEGGFKVDIDKVHIALITSSIELIGISIDPTKETSGNSIIAGEIESVRFQGFRIVKAILNKDISIRKVTVKNSRIRYEISLSKEIKHKIVSPLNIRIRRIDFDRSDVSIKSNSSSQSISVIEGYLNLYDLEIKKNDTLSSGNFRQLDFAAEKLMLVPPDSMYSYKVSRIIYKSSSNTLELDSIYVHPNYGSYEFTSKYKYQTSRFEAILSNISFQNFYVSDFIKTGDFISSSIQIGKMDMNIFRDKRKEFEHTIKPAFQDMIYDYSSEIRIDTIRISDGNIIYTEHAEKANEPGSISFNNIHAGIFNITNDTIYKTQNASLQLSGNALLMGKSKLTVLLSARLFDVNNTFSLSGTLSELEIEELNSILEKNAFFYATSGKLDGLEFSFTANNSHASGNMTMLYHGLQITIKNKRTDDTTAFKERLFSFIANIKVLDSNPNRREEVRTGIIDYKRDPERFLFHYCFRSILSGITSTLSKTNKK